MTTIINDTQYLGKNLILLQSIPSTNSYAKELLTKSKPKNGTVILAEEQTAGRGQSENIWQSNAKDNLTCSVILETHLIPASKQFLLNMAISLAVLHTTRAFTEEDSTISIKWPNDILVQQKKICGILIENTISGQCLQHSIIGIGLNVNQLDFGMHKQATSIQQITQKQNDVFWVLKKLLVEIERQLAFIQNEQYLKEQYLKYFFQLNQTAKYIYKEKEVLGIIKNVNEIGQLMIEIDGKIHILNMKEIKFLY